MMAPAEMATTASSRMEAPGRMPSIEWEPKTLTLDQIKYAREAALYVVSTKTEEEAIRIFTEGLKPVQVATAPSPASPAAPSTPRPTTTSTSAAPHHPTRPPNHQPAAAAAVAAAGAPSPTGTSPPRPSS